MRRSLAALSLLTGAALTVVGWIVVSGPGFHAGLLLTAATLMAVCAARRERAGTIAFCSTLASLLVGIVLIDRFWQWSDVDEPDELATHSFVRAAGDPDAYVRWHKQNMEERRRTRENRMQDPRGVNPWVLRPGEGKFYDSTWWVNSRGFRGPEISIEKGNHYRIFALGESTTFGETHRADDRPWPELLEEHIAREFDCEQPVQVINAGMPGWTLANNLARLRSDVFPLEPDLILSYHGYNGFSYFLEEIPSVSVGEPPEAPPRPSPLLTRIESALRLWHFMRRYRAARSIDGRTLEAASHLSRYADLYHSLASEARHRGVSLALAAFNMAVTPESPDEVVRFYEPVFPDLRARILANRVHTRLVRQIAEQSGALFIDTSPDLDGAHEDAYVDPVHFTQLGRERLAAHFFEALRDLLALKPPGCTPMSTGSSN